MVKQPKQQYRLALLGFSILVWLGIGYYSLVAMPGTIDQAASVAVYPFLWLQRRVVAPCKAWLAYRKTKHELEDALCAMQEENRTLRACVVELNSSIAYMGDIKELQEFQRRYNLEQTTCAQILVHHLTDHEHYLLIDKGSYHGTQQDMVAIYKNCLLGKVTEVYPFYSKVLLVSDATCKVAACCVRTRSTGIHVGNNTIHSSLLQRVDHLSTIELGDQVLSSGEGLIFPQGFDLGVVASVATSGLYHEVGVTPCIDVRSIKYCLLMQKGKH